MRKKGLFSVLTCTALAASVLAGCGTQSATSTASKAVSSAAASSTAASSTASSSTAASSAAPAAVSSAAPAAESVASAAEPSATEPVKTAVSSAAEAVSTAAAASTPEKVKEEPTGGIDISVTDGSEDAMNVSTAQASTLAGLSVCRHLYEGLYKLDAKGDLVLGQAEDQKVSDDGKTYTFTLRDDITWSDGRPVTAEDFVYGWKYLKEQAGDYSTLMDMVQSATAKDDKTLVVTLSYPCAYLPSILAFPSAYPVREDVVKKTGESYATDPDKAVYNGAYELTDWTHQQSMTLTKRTDYYDASSITVDHINWVLMSDAATMANSFKSGDVIYSDSYPEEDVDALTDNGLHFTDGYNTYCTMFNVGDSGNKVLKDAKVRRALTLAIDRSRVINIRGLEDELANTYTPGGLKNAEGTEFNSTVTPWYSDDYDENVKEAKELLKEAGYEDEKNFPALRYIVNNDSRKTVAEAIVSDWKEALGIDSITVESVENFFSARQSGDYDIAYYGWYMDYPDISNMLSTMTTGQNDAKYSNTKYDDVYNKAIAESDEKARWKDYDECESILAEDCPIAPILHSKNSYLFDDTNYDGLVYYCGNAFFGFVTQK